jgi:hypothetical protein
MSACPPHCTLRARCGGQRHRKPASLSGGPSGAGTVQCRRARDALVTKSEIPRLSAKSRRHRTNRMIGELRSLGQTTRAGRSRQNAPFSLELRFTARRTRRSESNSTNRSSSSHRRRFHRRLPGFLQFETSELRKSAPRGKAQGEGPITTYPGNHNAQALGARHLSAPRSPALPPCCSNRPTPTSQTRFWSVTFSTRSPTREVVSHS